MFSFKVFSYCSGFLLLLNCWYYTLCLTCFSIARNLTGSQLTKSSCCLDNWHLIILFWGLFFQASQWSVELARVFPANKLLRSILIPSQCFLVTSMFLLSENFGSRWIKILCGELNSVRYGTSCNCIHCTMNRTVSVH